MKFYIIKFLIALETKEVGFSTMSYIFKEAFFIFSGNKIFLSDNFYVFGIFFMDSV
jgi:hypothetical protein